MLEHLRKLEQDLRDAHEFFFEHNIGEKAVVDRLLGAANALPGLIAHAEERINRQRNEQEKKRNE